MTVDLYDILGVDRGAGEREIKRAFRRLAKEYHPDRNPNDPEAEQQFKEALAAFEILSDPEQRRRYDRYGLDGIRSPDKASFEAAEGSSGREREEPWWRAGADVDGTVSEVFGAEDPFDFSHFEEIGDFEFSGSFDETFRGSGRDGEDVVRGLEVGLLEALRGAEVGVRTDEGRVRIELERGIASGDRMRIPGRGEPAPDEAGEDGDLVVEIEVADHPVLARDGLDLEMELSVTVGEATLGAGIEVPTPWGAVELEVPAGVDSGDRLRLEGLGVRRGGDRGDLFARLRIVTPGAIDEREREAARTLEEAYEGGVRRDLEL